MNRGWIPGNRRKSKVSPLKVAIRRQVTKRNVGETSGVGWVGFFLGGCGLIL